MTAPAREPIPIPPVQRWREFRQRVLPVAVFAGVLLLLASLWRDQLAAPVMVGQAEAQTVNIGSPQPGTLTGLNVSRFQRVRAGEIVGHILVADARLIAANLAVYRAEIDALRAGAGDRPLAAHQRNAMEYIRLRLDWMRQRAALASAQVNLQLAEAEVARTEALFAERVAAQTELDIARATRDAYRREIEELEKLVADAEAGLKALSPEGGLDLARVTDDSLRAAIGVQEANLRLIEAQLAPVPLIAPVDGMVTTVWQRSGEAVMAGAPVVTVTAERATTIVAYLRQPALVEPAIGTPVTVRSRSGQRMAARSQVAGVGVQLEPLPEALRSTLRFTLTNAELGLPVSIPIPPELRLRPGEVVDVLLEPKGGE
ncbi:MAG: HlyD family secretion protein [Limisphaerales bacterium]